MVLFRSCIKVPKELAQLLFKVRSLAAEYNGYSKLYFKMNDYWVRAKPNGMYSDDLNPAALIIRSGRFPYRKLVDAWLPGSWAVYKLDKGFLPELLKLKSTLEERLNFRKQTRQSSDAEWKEALK